jgi:hypothetical protein
MTSTLITAYMGQGLLAARPATPLIATGTFGYYYATDNSTLYIYAGGVWSIFGSGNGANITYVPAGGGFNTTSAATACQGTPFNPSLTLKFFKAVSILSTVAGATYKVGFAPWDTVNKKVLSAPTYSNTVTAAFTGASQALMFDFATQQTATAGTDYILFYMRTDSTANVSITFNYCTDAVVGPGYFRSVVAGALAELASLAPTTSDVWTTGNNPLMCLPVYTL